MACLKCGREVPEGKLFCSECLELMEQYPVPHGIAIQLPVRRESPSPRRNGKRRAPPPEEQIRRLRVRLRTVTVLLVVTTALAGVLGYFAVRTILDGRLPLGQNYSIVQSSEPTGDVSRETFQSTP